jgi:hypothetical protein
VGPDFRAFNQAYDAFSKRSRGRASPSVWGRVEVQGWSKRRRPQQQQEREKAKLERQRQAERDAEIRTRQGLKAAQAEGDRLTESEILTRMAEKLLEGKR